MANVPVNTQALVLSSKNGTANYVWGSGSNALPSCWTFHIIDTGSLSASIVVKARSASVETPAATAYLATVYRKLYLNGAVADGSLVSTSITGNSIIIVPTTGLQVSLDVTFTSGTGLILAVPSAGPSVI